MTWVTLFVGRIVLLIIGRLVASVWAGVRPLIMLTMWIAVRLFAVGMWKLFGFSVWFSWMAVCAVVGYLTCG